MEYNVPRMSKEDLKAHLNDPDVVIIDVRADKDWNSSDAKIKSAIREEPKEVEKWMAKYPKNKTLAFY